MFSLVGPAGQLMDVRSQKKGVAAAPRREPQPISLTSASPEESTGGASLAFLYNPIHKRI